MIKYFTEEADENIKMDVQVGPEEEEVVGPDDEEICNNPVEEAKKNPENVCVACHTDENGVNEYYVDAEDIANLADLNEETMIDALNQVIEVNESSDMCADNLVVVFTEATKEYERNLERHGVICYEADGCGVEDIEMDVQVGPNGEEMHAEEDPQEANPVDAVKRGYDSVVIAGQDDNFFMDVEDVQKCAELNCESVIDTLNGIISVNEEYDMNPENIILVCNEDTDEALMKELSEAGVIAKIKRKIKGIDLIKELKRHTAHFFKENGVANLDLRGLPIEKKGKVEFLLLSVNAIEFSGPAVDAIKLLKSKNKDLINYINEKVEGLKVKSVKTETLKDLNYDAKIIFEIEY